MIRKVRHPRNLCLLALAALLSAAAPPQQVPQGSPAAQSGSKGTAPVVETKPAPKAEAKPKLKLTEGQIDFCNVVYQCRLGSPRYLCPDSASVEKPKFKYDSVRCFEARLLNSRGVTPAHPTVGYKLYRFLGMEYRVIYDVEEDLPISEARLNYLLADLPLSARILTHYRKEAYTVAYQDAERNHFKGAKGKRLKGEARMISGSYGERRLFYFGVGVATVAFWTLKGPALLDFQYWNKGKGLRYKMKVLVFPGNGFINGIMNLGLFRKIVYGKIKEMLDDITYSATKLAETGAKDILASKDWTPEEKQKIEAFLKLP